MLVNFQLTVATPVFMPQAAPLAFLPLVNSTPAFSTAFLIAEPHAGLLCYYCDGTKSGETAMADRPTTYRPITDEEVSRARSVLTLGILAACLIILLLLIGFGVFGSKTVAPNTPQPTTQSPTTSPKNP
jgi:hypothetical protein